MWVVEDREVIQCSATQTGLPVYEFMNQDIDKVHQQEFSVESHGSIEGKE